MNLKVNGADVEVDDRHAKTPLLWVLRDVLGMPGTKFARRSGGVGRVGEGSCVPHGILRVWRMQAPMRIGRAMRSWPR
jgi:hypothetical protein